MAEPIRVLLVDDHPVVRAGLRALFETIEGIEVVAEAADGAGAVRDALIGRARCGAARSADAGHGWGRDRAADLARGTLAHFASGAGSSSTVFPSLTPRERDVLELISRGTANATIAHELMISLKTARNHVSNIFTKLQVNDRAAAIVKAREAGYPTEGSTP